MTLNTLAYRLNTDPTCTVIKGVNYARIYLKLFDDFIEDVSRIYL